MPTCWPLRKTSAPGGCESTCRDPLNRAGPMECSSREGAEPCESLAGSATPCVTRDACVRKSLLVLVAVPSSVRTPSWSSGAAAVDLMSRDGHRVAATRTPPTTTPSRKSAARCACASRRDGARVARAHDHAADPSLAQREEHVCPSLDACVTLATQAPRTNLRAARRVTRDLEESENDESENDEISRSLSADRAGAHRGRAAFGTPGCHWSSESGARRSSGPVGGGCEASSETVTRSCGACSLGKWPNGSAASSSRATSLRIAASLMCLFIPAPRRTARYRK